MISSCHSWSFNSWSRNAITHTSKLWLLEGALGVAVIRRKASSWNGIFCTLENSLKCFSSCFDEQEYFVCLLITLTSEGLLENQMSLRGWEVGRPLLKPSFPSPCVTHYRVHNVSRQTNPSPWVAFWMSKYSHSPTTKFTDIMACDRHLLSKGNNLGACLSLCSAVKAVRNKPRLPSSLWRCPEFRYSGWESIASLPLGLWQWHHLVWTLEDLGRTVFRPL